MSIKEIHDELGKTLEELRIIDSRITRLMIQLACEMRQIEGSLDRIEDQVRIGEDWNRGKLNQDTQIDNGIEFRCSCSETITFTKLEIKEGDFIVKCTCGIKYRLCNKVLYWRKADDLDTT